MQGVLLILLVKDKLPHSRKVHLNAKELQLKPLRREKDYFFLSPRVFQLPLFRYSLGYFYAVIRIETVNFCVKLFWYNMQVRYKLLHNRSVISRCSCNEICTK